MINIDLSPYSPIISDANVGEEIYKKISTALINDTVEVDMTNIRSMASFCAKQIFGHLYKDLGPEDFYERIAIKNASPSVKVIIRLGITHAID